MTDTPDPSSSRIRSKLRRAAKRVGLSGEPASTPETRRLPPGQRLVGSLPVLDLGMTPDIRAGEWRLTVAGAVEASVTWDWDDFMAQSQTTMTHDIHCVTNWSVYDQDWTGVAAKTLLDWVRPRASAKVVMMKSHDGYSTNVPLTVFAGMDVILAHSLNGAPLTPEHGGPVRAVIPSLYFWKSAKWLRRIEFLTEDAPGYWEARGYHNDGDPWKEQRYDGS